jgi:hypothetical protein
MSLKQDIATAGELVEVLTALLANVEHRHRQLRLKAEAVAARKH